MAGGRRFEAQRSASTFEKVPKHSRGPGQQPANLSPKIITRTQKGIFFFFALIELNPEEERRD